MSAATQPSSTNAADEFQPMIDDQESPLLSLPSGVEVLLLSFLSAGKGGLQNVLKLRSVCSTTRSWVDNLPKPVANLVFSKAQVTMEGDLSSLRKFHSTSPPFGVTTLDLTVLEEPNEDWEEEEREWSVFCALWRPKLETIELAGSYCSPLVMPLLDSPNINRISLTDDSLMRHNSHTNLPSSFQFVSEVRMSRNYPGGWVGLQLFFFLRNNSNLRVFTFEALDAAELEAVTQLIDAKKHSPHFQLNLTLFYFKHVEGISQLTKSILASRSQVCLKLWHWDQSMLLHHDGPSLWPMVDHIHRWDVTEHTLSLLHFPRLKTVDHVKVSHSTTTAQLKFPPSLEKMEISKGFPTCANLTETLKRLSLSSYTCNFNQLMSSLSNLSRRCPELEHFLVDWTSLEARQPTLNFEDASQGFEKLRRLSFEGKRVKEDVECIRSGLSNVLNWRKMELHRLRVRLYDSHHRKLPLLDEETLRDILEGPSGKSLHEIQIHEEFVTPEAVPMLRKLKASVAENRERLLQREGRGAWQQNKYY